LQRHDPKVDALGSLVIQDSKERSWVSASGIITLGSETLDIWTNESVGAMAVIAIQQGVNVNPGT
jgi:hypothetical protein